MYARWSEYETRHGEKPVDGWADTISIAAGTTFENEKRAFGLDLSYVPSPVPEQIGRTNFVDNDTISIGSGYEEKFQIDSFKISAILSCVFNYLIPKSVDKNMLAKNPVTDELPDNAQNYTTGETLEGAQGLQTNNPGFPGYESGGIFLTAGINLRVHY